MCRFHVSPLSTLPRAICLCISNSDRQATIQVLAKFFRRPFERLRGRGRCIGPAATSRDSFAYSLDRCASWGKVIPFSFADVTSGNHTEGHRFLGNTHVPVSRASDYEAKLKRILFCAVRKLAGREFRRNCAPLHRARACGCMRTRACWKRSPTSTNIPA